MHDAHRSHAHSSPRRRIAGPSIGSHSTEACMQLYIGNKNYSSWSLRAWLALAQLDIPFEEVKLRLSFAGDSDFKHQLADITPTGKVPVLVDDGFAVWDTLAIVEYLADKLP